MVVTVCEEDGDGRVVLNELQIRCRYERILRREYVAVLAKTRCQDSVLGVGAKYRSMYVELSLHQVSRTSNISLFAETFCLIRHASEG